MQLYCSECEDYTYLEEYEAISFAAGLGFRGELGALSELVTDVVPRHHPKTESPEDKATEGLRRKPAESPSVDGFHDINGINDINDINDTNGVNVGDQSATPDAKALKEAGYEAIEPSDGFPIGLRGLNNLGNSCFASSILQAFIRTPMLAEYYLSARHCEANCRVSAEGGHCIECQLDKVISNVFSGNRVPFSPAEFLHTWWMMAGDVLSGYKQQDAHEFFLFILQMLTGHPDSIATSLFIGQVQSRVFCQGCGRNSVQKDEFSHLSLDVLPSGSLVPPAIAPRAKQNPVAPRKKGARGAAAKSAAMKAAAMASAAAAAAGSGSGPAATATATATSTAKTPAKAAPTPPKATKTIKKTETSWNHPALEGYLRWPGDSLIGCLRRFTFAEILDGTSDDWRCTECNSGNSGDGNNGNNGNYSDNGDNASASRAIKQTSITKLPPVLTMHLKRFDFLSGPKAGPTKIETFVSFPLDGLDMSPYLTSRIDLGRHGVGAHLEFLYDAFAVVCHRGTCSGGHYVSYVRVEDRWYLCDDAFIIEVSKSVVEQCQAYLVFYALRQNSTQL